jgi:hypothetical protein
MKKDRRIIIAKGAYLEKCFNLQPPKFREPIIPFFVDYILRHIFYSETQSFLYLKPKVDECSNLKLTDIFDPSEFMA